MNPNTKIWRFKRDIIRLFGVGFSMIVYLIGIYKEEPLASFISLVISYMVIASE